MYGSPTDRFCQGRKMGQIFQKAVMRMSKRHIFLSQHSIGQAGRPRISLKQLHRQCLKYIARNYRTGNTPLVTTTKTRKNISIMINRWSLCPLWSRAVGNVSSFQSTCAFLHIKDTINPQLSNTTQKVLNHGVHSIWVYGFQ